MMRLISSAAVLSALLGVSALAQTKAAPPQKPPTAMADEATSPQEPPPFTTEEPGEENATLAPVLWITSVETLSSTHGPQLDVIRVRGLTSTDGWEGGQLIPITKGESLDGMLDLVFVAQPPSDTTTTTGFPTIEAVFTIEPGHPYKGVRVHSATNRVTVKSIPGYVEAPAPPDDCSKCVGKYFVGKGESLPSGATAENSVREESLPKMLHVIRASDGVGKIDTDPNRLTLVLGEDGRIVVAVWD